MGADSLAENTPNAPEFICPMCLPKPKSSGFQWKKASLGVRSPWILPLKKMDVLLSARIKLSFLEHINLHTWLQENVLANFCVNISNFWKSAYNFLKISPKSNQLTYRIKNIFMFVNT